MSKTNQQSEAGNCCLLCGTDVDPDEFGDARDADICGYCFVAKVSEIRIRRGDKFAPGLNKCGRDRELALQTECEIRRDLASKKGDDAAVEIWDRVLRLIEA